MAEDIILRYRAETDELTKELNLIIEQQEKLEQSADKTSKDVQKSVSVEATALKQRQQLIEKELQTITKLQAARARASDPKVINKFNAAIAQSERNVRSLQSATEKAGREIQGNLGSIKNVALGIATGIGAAFTVDAIINFGKASVNAFLEAETNAKRLGFAIKSIGGETEQAFERLIKQSEKLQKVTIFSDDSIQQAQAALAAFDLTSVQIEELLPLLADFATVTGQDITQAAQQVGAGLEGAGRELKKYGIEVSATASSQENLNSIMQGFAKFTGAAAAELETTEGQLKSFANEFDNFQERIGEFLVRFASNFSSSIRQIGSDFAKLIQQLGLAPDVVAPLETTADAFDKFRQEINKSLLETSTLAEFDARAEEIRAAATRGVDNVLLDIQRLERARDQAQAREKVNVNEVFALNQAIENQRKTALANEQLRLQLVEESIGLIRQEFLEKERILTAEGLRSKSVSQLNALLKENQRINDDISSRNIPLLVDELKLRDQRITQEKEVQKLLPITAEAVKGLTDEQLTLIRLWGLAQSNVAAFREEIEKLNDEVEKGALDEFEKDLEKLNKRRREAGEDITPVYITDVKEFEKTWLGANEEILRSSLDLFSQLSFLNSQFSDQRIEQLQTEQELNDERLSEEERLLQDSLDKRIISEGEYEKKSEALRLKRVENEKKLQAAINKEKRKQALLDRINAVFEITINTAIAATKALATPPAPNVVLAALAGALGAAQLATALAAPIPAYAKGTKKAKGGMSLVGEQGAEIMYVPKDAKILPAQKTKNYGEVLDAMYDNRFDRFILDRYVAPALAEQKKRYENKQQETFASNIVNSMTVNGLTLGDVMYANKKGINIKNIEDLSKGVARELAPLLPTIDLRRL